jgi:type II secretory ATPase GspE/PulE/Tfp pilus assembly ATPase PilB-like protein
MVEGMFTATVDVGHYISVFKTIPLLLILMLWARMVTWIDKDAPAAHLPRVPINTGMLLGGIIAFGLFFLLGPFWLSLLVLLFLIAAEAGVYLLIRNQKVGLGDLGKQWQDWINSFTSKKQESKLEAGAVQVLGRGGNPLPVPEGESPQRAAYETVQTILTEPLRRGSDRIDLAPSDGAATLVYEVDGVAYTGGELSRTNSAAAIAYLKKAAGLDLEERRKPQVGTLRAMLEGNRHEMQLRTAGSAYGEQMRLIVNPQNRHSQRLEDLGMREAQIKTVRDLIIDNSGLVVVSAPKGQGLTTTVYGIIRGHDAFLSHIQTIERHPTQDLEGVTQNRIALNAPPGEETRLATWIASQEPDVVMIDQVEDPQTARVLTEFAASGKRVYVGMRAANTFDAMTRWRKLVGDDQLAMPSLRLLVASRVLRRLCSACKVPYAPDPSMVRKLNLDVERSRRLFQARTQPLRDQKGNPVLCPFCHELRYKGRMGVFELFVVDEELRQTVLAGGSVPQMKALFRKQRGRFLQEEALNVVEEGETSVQEVLRVLRGETTTATVEPQQAETA